MRRGVVVAVLILLTACEDRRSFDERYEDTANQLEQRATNIDAELNKTAHEEENTEAPTEDTGFR